MMTYSFSTLRESDYTIVDAPYPMILAGDDWTTIIEHELNLLGATGTWCVISTVLAKTARYVFSDQDAAALFKLRFL